MNEEKIRILLVEDDKDDYLLFKTYLSKLPFSYTLDWVHTYEDGIKRLKQKSNFHLCFVDYHLGAQNGIEFIKEVKSLSLTQPIIMLTGQGDEKLGLLAVRTGAEDFYNKSGINAETLNRAIRFTLERQKAHLQEQELVIANREKNLFSTIFEKAPAFICILRGKQHTFEMANPAYYQLIGGYRNIIGKTVIDAIPEIKGQGFIEMLDGVLKSGQPRIEYEIKALLRRKNGGPLEERYINFVYQPVFETNGHISGIFVHGIDVTDQVISKIELERSQQRLELAQKAGNIGSFEWLYKKKRVIWTPEIEALYGLKPGTLDGSLGQWREYVHPEDIEMLDVVMKAIEDKDVSFNTEYRVIWPDKSEHWLLSKGDIFYDTDGEAVRIVGVNIDISERKALERQKDDFMGIASHELKTPVTSIKAFTQVLASRFAKVGDENATLLLKKMDGQINKLSALINDLLDVTKIEGGRLQFNEGYFYFDELVDEIVEEVQRTTSKHTLIKEGTTKKTIYGDRDRVGQVITNFLTNAIKYSPHTDKIYIKTTTDKNNLTLSVQDFGVGIPKDKQPYVFERFYRVSGKTHDTVPGIGLGLFISAEIVRRLGGDIWVESEKRRGSTFHFSLPVTKQKIKQQKNTLVEQEIQHG